MRGLNLLNVIFGVEYRVCRGENYFKGRVITLRLEEFVRVKFRL